MAARAFQLPLAGGVLHRVMRPGQGEDDDLYAVQAAARPRGAAAQVAWPPRSPWCAAVTW